MINEIDLVSKNLEKLKTIRRRFNHVFNDHTITTNSLPISIEEKDGMPYLCSNKTKETISFNSENKTYFDQSFFTINHINNRSIIEENPIFKRIIQKNSNDSTISKIMKKIEEKPTTTRKITFEKVKLNKTEDPFSSDWFFSKELNFAQGNIDHKHIQCAINNSKIFEIIKLLTKLESKYIKSIENYCDECHFLDPNKDEESNEIIEEINYLASILAAYENSYIETRRMDYAF